MSNNDVETSLKRFIPSKFVVLFILIYLLSCDAENFAKGDANEKQLNVNYSNNTKTSRLFKRNSGKRCYNSSDCSSELEGSLCIQNTCVCPQGYLPIKRGVVGCFQVGKQLGSFCNLSIQCGEELTCKNHVCLCPDGFQLYQTQGTNICLLWHKPTRLDRCRNNEDCSSQDPNNVCKKRWCQCNSGYQLFETMLFGRKHKCFKTFRFQCDTSDQCLQLTEAPDQFCTCLYGVCHCMSDTNLTTLDFPSWTERPHWYQRWKKDLILATRLLFITVILFFVPCFIYVTLGMRDRSRQLFSQFLQPTRSPGIHYSHRRNSHVRPMHMSLQNCRPSLTSFRSSSDSHQVEITLHPNGVNSRIVEFRPRSLSHPRECDLPRQITRGRSSESDAKEEDPPPSYEEIMHNVPEEPPPPYQAL